MFSGGIKETSGVKYVDNICFTHGVIPQIQESSNLQKTLSFNQNPVKYTLPWCTSSL